MSTSLAVILGGISAVLLGQTAETPPASLFEHANAPVPATRIDTEIVAVLQQHNLKSGAPCSDPVFIRRVYLDTIGTLPEPSAVETFLNDPQPDKRARLIDDLLARDEFATYGALKWCDILRVKSEFPVNLWPNAVQTYHRWVYEALRSGMPYDDFARALLTSSGSNFRVPPVNFYRALQVRNPEEIATAVALTLMGARLDTWPEEQRNQMAVFFSRVAYKKTAEWKEEIVYCDPAPRGPLKATLPDGTAVDIPPDVDPRTVFADWLLRPDNPWFARNAVNRVWAWLLGRGIIHEPDDIRPDNPPVNPALLTYLEQELRNSGYDLKHIYQLILNSRTYQQSALPQASNPEAEQYFACYPVRPLGAEVLCDALARFADRGEAYQSMIPEPFTYVPHYERTIALADGSITSPFLEMFGRPTRDTGLVSERDNETSDKQRLYLLNSTDVQRKIERSPRLSRLIGQANGNRETMVRSIYLNILSRPPSPQEQARAVQYAQESGLNLRQSMADLAWALVNSKEFLYRH